MNKKPYFCPLYKEFFFKIESGEQDCEIKPNNYRGWNIRNIYPDRDITFSNGYGNYNRVTKQVRSTMVTLDLNMENIPQWHIDAVKKIYPWADEWLVAYV